MSAPGTPKASDAAVAAVQDALGEHQRTEVMDGERFGGGLLNARLVIRCTCGEPWGLDHVAVAAADAAAPHVAAQTLRDAADEAEEFATETYALDIFRKPSPEDYAAINALLDRERGHKLDGVAADCYRRAIGLTAKRLRETASDIEAGQ